MISLLGRRVYMDANGAIYAVEEPKPIRISERAFSIRWTQAI